MELDLHLQGVLATLPGESLRETALLGELMRRGFSAEDSRLALEKAVIEGFLVRQGDGSLTRRSQGVTASSVGGVTEA